MNGTRRGLDPPAGRMEEITMERITRAEFEKLPREWKEPWHDYWGDHPEWLGKWTAFLPGHGTTLFIEGVSFEIVEGVIPT